MVSAGDAGANAIAIFRRHITAQTRTRLFSFVHIATHGLGGFPVPELYNIDFAQVEMAAKAVAENADVVLGVKVRMSENVIAKHGSEPLKRAIAACEMSGTGAKVMVHIGGVESDRVDVTNSRSAQAGRCTDSLLLGRTEHRWQVHEHHPGRQAVAGRPGSQKARRGL